MKNRELQAVKSAIQEIQKQSNGFEVWNKENESKSNDYVTSADYAAQQIYTTMIAKYNSDAGIIAEENGLRQEPQNGSNIYYTIDPLDGTSAFVRKQSDGIWTLFGKIDKWTNKIIAAYIWDVMTGEIYYYDKNSNDVIRSNIRQNYQNQILKYQNRTKKRLLSLDDIRELPEWADKITKPQWYRDSIWVSNGSIGTNMAKLRKWEVDAVLLKSWYRHPRDEVPYIWIWWIMWYTSINIQENWEVSHITNLDEDMTINSRQIEYQLIVHKEELDDVLRQIHEAK